ncbi:putative NRPS-like protein biosynthetic cluster [Claviceps africana]|uniref:NRPS-like protein biosynthetic cluster n=1 Tax=Claviceps africana TaxID=83212 RepID=A0A8K0J1H0_9HYPO|nr:putative NRPS-like protein biosynthetic cluster [Claviceps africana]
MGNPLEAQGIWTLSQLLYQRAIDQDQTPLLAFSRSKNAATDFERFAGRTLYRFINAAAKSLADKGLPPVDPEEQMVVGVCAPTDLDYLVTIFALIQLGYVPMQISTRLAPGAMVELLKTAQNPRQRLVMLCGSSVAAEKLQRLRQDLEVSPLATRGEYDQGVNTDEVHAPTDEANHASTYDRPCIILHSSGSTGLPKPIDYSHRKLLNAATYAPDTTAFTTLPFSHSLGMMTYMQAFAARRTMFAMNGHVPQTHATVTAALAEARPDIVWTVPYVLKLLAERPEGIEVLRKCRFVSSGGSRLPDELGDLLTEHGVHVASQFGS